MQPKKTLDITADFCPITFVKTKLALEEMAAGEILEVILAGKVAVQNVPRSVEHDGHKVHALSEQPGGIFRLLIEKDGGRSRPDQTDY
ncbi:MAG: sulfurtransferase TusA family protein [Firmicutes bacterium]|nr:sulfurtransferase TusA family protein [Bacillota bacterium]